MIYIISGLFTLVCFGSYFIKLIISPEGTLPWIATSTVICTVTLPYIFRKQLKRLLKRAYIPLAALMCAGMVFYSLSFLFLIGYIYLSPSDPPPSSGCAYVVFGAKINGTRPSKTLAARLDTAVSLLEADPDGICVVSGGRGRDEAISEGECMRDYLVSQGIAEERIYVESKAGNTAENIRLSVALLSETGNSARSVVCVSSDTHIPRIRMLCKEEGVTAACVKAPTPPEAYVFTNLVREYLSYARMLLVGY